MTSYYDATSSPGDYWPLLCNDSYSKFEFKFECNVCNVNNAAFRPVGYCSYAFADQYMVCSVPIEPKMSSGGHRAAENRVHHYRG